MNSLNKNYANFRDQPLDDECSLWVGQFPEEIKTDFEELWNLHPSEYHEIRMLGRKVKTPRWQQAYGMDYRYTGQVNKALPVLPVLVPILAWSHQAIDGRLNGLLINWYDGKLGHYIGRHRDSISNMVPGAPIVTVSLGESRTFRLRSRARKGFTDFPATDRTVFIMPFDTNLKWTHEVPTAAKNHGRRISITLRAFNE